MLGKITIIKKKENIFLDYTLKIMNGVFYNFQKRSCNLINNIKIKPTISLQKNTHKIKDSI